MKQSTKTFENGNSNFDQAINQRLMANPLIKGILDVGTQVLALKRLARQFYYEVILMAHPCPTCGNRLRMTGPSQCDCDCGVILDPTVAFQQCPDCQSTLTKKTYHYACSNCGKTVPSQFLFGERVFSPEYFRRKMAKCREHQQRQREEIRLLLATSRSKPLGLSEIPRLEEVPGLIEALDSFIGHALPIGLDDFNPPEPFRLEDYRNHILSIIEDCCIRFNAISQMEGDTRRDRTRRFTTLIYMRHDGEVELSQRGPDDLLVWKYEADIEGC